MNKGEVQWDKNAVTVADFFKYLKGKDGATGTSAYDQWKKEIESGNVENPHKKGEKWSADRNSVQDFFYFITGAMGEKGEQGPQGERGQQGIQGPQGEQGQPGTNGRDGADGRDGTDGNDGTNGTDGRNGTDGTNGLSAYELWKATAETGNLDSPHKEGEKWDKAKVSESDFWEYLRGADAVAPTITEKGVTPLEVTKEEEGEGVKWVVEVTTAPNSTVTFSNGKVKKTAQANADGVATVELDRDIRRDLQFSVNATAEGKIQSETLMITVPKAKMFFTPKYEETTYTFPKLNEGGLAFLVSTNDTVLVEGGPYGSEKVSTSSNAYMNGVLSIFIYRQDSINLTLPVDFKGAEEVSLANPDLTGKVIFDKENKTLTIKNIIIARRFFDRQRALEVNQYDKPLGHDEKKEENVSYSVSLEKYGSIPLKFHVKYIDGNITKPIPFLIWSVSWIWQSSTLPEE